jgi:hypothetical protein
LDSSTWVGNDNAIRSLFRNRQQTCLFDGFIRIARSLVPHDSNPNLLYRPVLDPIEYIKKIRVNVPAFVAMIIDPALK